jgi:hypothetical protein
MKRISSLTALTLIALLFLVPGCKKETTTTTPVTGNLFGFVSLYDQYGGKIVSGLGSTTVTLNTPSGSALTANPDSTGKYTFSNIVQGQYTISFTNTGFGSIVNTELGFLGEGNIDHDAKLSSIPNYTDSILSTPIDTGGYLVLNGTFSGTDIRKRTYLVFFGATPSVSSAPANYINYYSGTANNNLTTFTLKIPVSDLNDAGFTSGSTVYFAAYGAAADFASQSEVEDYTSGKLIFNAISAHPSTISFTLP